jgi:hypothetical protein
LIEISEWFTAEASLRSKGAVMCVE